MSGDSSTPASERLPRRLVAFVSVVALLGATLLAAVLARGGLTLDGRFLALAAGTAIAELSPITVSRRDDQSVSLDTSFALALALVGGVAAGLIAQVAAEVLVGTVRRRPPIKFVFNASQKALSIAAACGVMTLAHASLRAHGWTGAVIAALPIACFTHAAVNNGLVTTVLALSQRLPVLRYVRRQILHQPLTALITVVMVPLVAQVALGGAVLIPVLAIPIWAVWRSARQSARIEHDALHDPLTGLPNRRMLEGRLDDALGAGPVALLAVEIDRFDEVTETLGHGEADRLLIHVAKRVEDALPDEDALLAHVSGHQLAVMLRGIPSDRATAIAHALVDLLERPFEAADLEVALGATIGVATAPEAGRDAPTLLRAAEAAMRSAAEARGSVHLFEPERDASRSGRLALLSELRGALRRDELVAHYQPQIDLQTGRMQSVEALVRWITPDGRRIAPNEFVPHAERTGLMRPLTLRMLDQALEQRARWAADGLELMVAVNLSPRSFHDARLVRDVRAALQRWDAGPDALELEITESTTMADPERARRMLTELQDNGVRVSIDDFGTGYSSLAWLGRLPVHAVKIDRSFLLEMERDPANAIIVRSTIELGHGLGLRVVAEGVETTEMRDTLAELGCDAGQGFLWSPAVPGEGIETIVRDTLNLPA